MTDDPQTRWYLEGFADQSERYWRTAIRPLPFRVGRHAEADLPLSSERVSKQQAEIFVRDGRPWVRDLGSTNGTFVNGTRVRGELAVDEEDILHFADQEFRLVRFSPGRSSVTTRIFTLSDADLPRRLVGRTHQFRDMLRRGEVEPAFQPIVRLADSTVIGYEALCRGFLEGVKECPRDLFCIAEILDLAPELSALCRRRGLEEAGALPHTTLFLNSHPAEFLEPKDLLDSFRTARASYPDLNLVLEVHEGAATDLLGLDSFWDELSELAVDTAFDDFGIGQARLLALAEVSPRYLKFHADLIRDLYRAPAKRKEIVEGLLRIARSLGISPIAEGIETREEAAACHDVGFEIGQGYLFGRPAPAEDLASGRS